MRFAVDGTFTIVKKRMNGPGWSDGLAWSQQVRDMVDREPRRNYIGGYCYTDDFRFVLDYNGNKSLLHRPVNVAVMAMLPQHVVTSSGHEPQAIFIGTVVMHWVTHDFEPRLRVATQVGTTAYRDALAMGSSETAAVDAFRAASLVRLCGRERFHVRLPRRTAASLTRANAKELRRMCDN